MTPDHLARASAQAMLADDNATKHLGMSLDFVAPGQATLSMTIRPEMTNGHKTCHGGFIFTLADSAFAFACNSYNQIVVAQSNVITFIAPGKLGDRLIAKAKEVARYGRSGIYDVTVTTQDGTLIAEFRGNSRVIKGQHFAE